MVSRLSLPNPSKDALIKLGIDISLARRRRSIQTKLMAARMGCSQVTLRKIERGDPNTSIGHYARALFVLGFTVRLSNLVDSGFDPLLRSLEENLPKRIRIPK